MHKSNEDCFYFLTSTCAKGAACTYRHSPLALTCNVICPAWLRGNCLDAACAFRHSQIQHRQMISNGILCYFENTPTGCLKLDCTFIHSRPRINLRNSSTIQHEIQSQIPKKINSDLNSIKTRRVAIPTETKEIDEKPNLLENKTTNRCVITDSSEQDQDEILTTNQSRLIANRNVVINEPNLIDIPIRKIVQTTPSNRVVVSSESFDLSSKQIKNDIDLNEQENKSKKCQKEVEKTVEISFPCSTQSITNRLLLMSSSKETISTNDKKPIRLKRDHLPETKISNGNSSNFISKSTNEEKTSAGTGLSQDDDERRSMRIERFQKKPISPPRPNVNSNERKRTAQEIITEEDSPPAKRISISTKPQKSSSDQTTICSSLTQPTSIVIKPINSTKSTEDDENQLLKLNDSTDIVDTFAAIDEALLEAEHLLDLM